MESARIIHDAGSSLLGLINDILDLSKIEAGRMEPVIDALPLVEFAQRLERSFAHVARERKLGFSVTLAPNLPATLRMEHTALVVVPRDQVSLAIGKEGQNARLAARLTGWRIDIRSDEAPDP